jgi:hypothetical protein
MTKIRIAAMMLIPNCAMICRASAMRFSIPVLPLYLDLYQKHGL